MAVFFKRSTSACILFVNVQVHTGCKIQTSKAVKKGNKENYTCFLFYLRKREGEERKEKKNET